MRALVAALCLLVMMLAPARAQDPGPLQTLLQTHREAIVANSRRAVEPALAEIAKSDAPGLAAVLERWEARDLWYRPADGLFFFATPQGDALALTDIDTGAPAGLAAKTEVEAIRPNSGIRGLIAAALVRFRLTDPATQGAALDAIARGPAPEHLDLLRAALAAGAAAPRLARLERLLTIRFDPDAQARIAAIDSLAGDLGVDARAALNPLVATTLRAAPGSRPPAGEN
ncbi:MAG: urea ABC transporter permease subunit UrtB, partial [Rhodobacterales bacterium]|nr:urea ABC transporter permease subunit UrtB [Rhodobacterales bacterium]